jgi:hypothetical protein
VAGVVALVLLAALAGCGVEETGISGADRRACRELVADLPDRLSDQPLDERLPDVPGATYGDPAIVVRCGVGRPDGYDPLQQCQVADGIGWFVPAKGRDDQSVDVVMTAISRTPYVEVTLPARYRPPVGAMVDLATTLRAHTTATTRCE